jgi:hypothetical protein
MSRGTILRASLVFALLALGIVYLLRSHMDETHATLLVTCVIGAVTTVYALFTFEILLQNRLMARATADSVKVMERSLRFSYAPNLLFRTLSTKDPSLEAYNATAAIENDDYKRALQEYKGGEQHMEFVFAVIQNVGAGPATNMSVSARYNIRDTNNPNQSYSVTKQAFVQLIEPNKAVGLCIYMSKVPTTDDLVQLESAEITSSDFYRDALGEGPQLKTVSQKDHHADPEAGCIVKIV